MRTILRIYVLSVLIMMFLSCVPKTVQRSNAIIEMSSDDSIKRMSVEDAEAYMFTKNSETITASSQNLSEGYKGEIYMQIQNSLSKNSLVSVLSDMINDNTDKMYSLLVQEEPIDTLFMDDFELIDGNIRSKRGIMELITYDDSWCYVLSEALEGVEKDKDFVNACKINLSQHEVFFDTLVEKLQKVDDRNMPHIPIMYVYRFSQFVGIYIESMQKPANYVFIGYTFVFTDNMKVGCVVEEFDF